VLRCVETCRLKVPCFLRNQFLAAWSGPARVRTCSQGGGTRVLSRYLSPPLSVNGISRLSRSWVACTGLLRGPLGRTGADRNWAGGGASWPASYSPCCIAACHPLSVNGISRLSRSRAACAGLLCGPLGRTGADKNWARGGASWPAPCTSWMPKGCSSAF
jgi:hypothetical protein